MSQQNQPQERREQGADPLPIEPGHVMPRAHYERLAREAAEQQK